MLSRGVIDAPSIDAVSERQKTFGEARQVLADVRLALDKRDIATVFQEAHEAANPIDVDGIAQLHGAVAWAMASVLCEAVDRRRVNIGDRYSTTLQPKKEML